MVFRIRSLEIRVDKKTLMAMYRGVTSTRVHSTRNPTTTTSTKTKLMEVLPIRTYHHILERTR